MDNPTLSINLGNSADITDPYWLNIEVVEDPAADGMSVAEAASLIDAAYNIKPCESSSENDIWAQGQNILAGDIWSDSPETTAIDQDTVDATTRFADALAVDYMDDCNVAGVDDYYLYDVEIKVFRSHRDESYKLQMANGDASFPARHQERVVKTVDVDKATSVTLDNPIGNWAGCKAPVARWQGADSTPEIHIAHNTLYWEGEVTGTIWIEFDTEWDQLTIKVHGEPRDSEIIEGTVPSINTGTGWYTGSESGAEIEENNSVQCAVLAFYHYQYEELVLSQPEADNSVTSSQKDSMCHFVMKTVDDDGVGGSDSDIQDDEDEEKECTQYISTTTICQCSGKEETEGHHMAVACPDGTSQGSRLPDIESTSYKDCGIREDVSKSSFYLATCCIPVPKDLQALFYPNGVRLPYCEDRVYPYSGLSDGDMKDKQSGYPEGTKFIVVAPEGGICGEMTVSQSISGDCNQCADAPTVSWDDARSVDVLAPEESGQVRIIGGTPPFVFRLNSSGLEFSNGSTRYETNNRYAGIKAHDDFCGSAKVSVKDGCNKETGGAIRSTEGVWNLVARLCQSCKYKALASNPCPQDYTAYVHDPLGCDGKELAHMASETTTYQNDTKTYNYSVMCWRRYSDKPEDYAICQKYGVNDPGEGCIPFQIRHDCGFGTTPWSYPEMLALEHDIYKWMCPGEEFTLECVEDSEWAKQ